MVRVCNSLTGALAAMLLAAAGCAPQATPNLIATRVIRPGDQHLTQPVKPQLPAASEAPAAAAAATETPAVASTAAASASPAAATPAAEPAAASASAAAAPTTAAATTESTGTEFAGFKGRVTVAGTAPSLPLLKAAGDPMVQDKVCVAAAIPDESLVVGPNGELANVFVFAKRLPAGVTAPPPPSEPVELDQKGCRFVPQAMVFRAGQPLLMKNSDPVSHNVRTSAIAMSINQIVPPNNTTGIAVTYKKPERMPVQTKCDIHAWMLAWHLPLDHPYAAVTGPDGQFEIKDLPAGEWEFVIWHGRTGYIERAFKVSAKAGQAVTHDFSVPAAKLSQ